MVYMRCRGVVDVRTKTTSSVNKNFLYIMLEEEQIHQIIPRERRRCRIESLWDRGPAGKMYSKEHD